MNKKSKILVVEPDMNLALFYRNVLRKFGFIVEAETDFLGARLKITGQDNGDFNLVVMNIGSKFEGYILVKTWRRLGQNIPVIFLHYGKPPDFFKKAYLKGVNQAHFQIPLKISELKDAIKKILKNGGQAQ